ncbi:MAG: heme-binding protein [Clostridiales bacterium]|jgi:uncharacterized protein GlcG (DUF336 family)|nr:heme-binding protein [Clostridiales bacterium]
MFELKDGKLNEITILTDELCDELSDAARDESEKIGIGVCLAIVDEKGVLLYFRRFKGSLVVSVGIAQNKAYTSAVMRKATGELAPDVISGGELFGINTADPRLAVFGGGFPLLAGGVMVGAIGVSGGSVGEDERIGNRVLTVFKRYIKEKFGL